MAEDIMSRRWFILLKEAANIYNSLLCITWRYFIRGKPLADGWKYFEAHKSTWKSGGVDVLF